MPQCQFLFSAVFGFRKVTQEIFFGCDKNQSSYFYRAEKEVREGDKVEHQGGHTMPRRGLALARA